MKKITNTQYKLLDADPNLLTITQLKKKISLCQLILDAEDVTSQRYDTFDGILDETESILSNRLKGG